MPVHIDQFNLQCTTGVINATFYEPEIGLISTVNSQYNFCSRQAPGFIDECSQFFDASKLRAEIVKNCDN